MAFYTLNSSIFTLNGGGSFAKVPTSPPVAPIALTALSGVAISATSGNLRVTCNRPCTLHWRIKSGSIPTNKVTEFPNVEQIPIAGTYTFPSGGALSPSTDYYCGAWATDSDANETDIAYSSPNLTFTTPAASSDVITTVVTPTAATVNEDTPIGTIVAQLTGNGVPAPTFSELTDTDNKFTVTVGGSVTLSAALDFTADTSHTLGHRAENSIGNYDSNFTLTVTESGAGGGGGITPDATVGSLAALESQLVAWDGTGTGTRYLALTASSYGACSISNKHFTAPVIVYGPDLDHTTLLSKLTITNCTNLTFYAMKIRPDAVTFGTGCTDCGIDNCIIRFSETPRTYAASGFGIEMNSGLSSTRLSITNNLVIGYINNIVYRPSPGTGGLIEGNVIGDCAADYMRISGTHTGLQTRRNWIGGKREPSSSAHPDMLQLKGGASALFWGNVMLTRDHVENDIQQGLYGTDTNSGDGTVIEQNIIMAAAFNALTVSLGGTLGPVRYNAVFPSNDQLAAVHRESRISVDGVTDYNIQGRFSGAVASGAHSVTLDIGTTTKTVPFNSAVYSAEFAQMFRGDASGTAFITENSSIYALLPPPGAQSSFDYAIPADRVGPYLRTKEIYDGVHPGLVCLPNIAQAWDDAFNADGRLIY